MDGFTSEPAGLRDAARTIDASAEQLDAVRQQVEATALTHDDWGTAWLTDPVRAAHNRVWAEQVDEIAATSRALRSAASDLLRSAEEYQRADQATSERAGEAGRADGGSAAPGPGRPWRS